LFLLYDEAALSRRLIVVILTAWAGGRAVVLLVRVRAWSLTAVPVGRLAGRADVV
jgi:hypothetical protein